MALKKSSSFASLGSAQLLNLHINTKPSMRSNFLDIDFLIFPIRKLQPPPPL